jgi:hypothetical protein
MPNVKHPKRKMRKMEDNYVIFEFCEMRDNVVTFKNVVENICVTGLMDSRTTLSTQMTIQELQHELYDIEIFRLGIERHTHPLVVSKHARNSKYLTHDLSAESQLIIEHENKKSGVEIENLITALALIGMIFLIGYAIDHKGSKHGVVVETHEVQGQVVKNE